jgi:hypothetical protein
MKWWREVGDGSLSAKVKRHADRLLDEFHRLNEMSSQILDELEAVAPATASVMSYRCEPAR